MTPRNGPPDHYPEDLTARGNSVRAGLFMAESLGLDGICAVGRDTPWYSRVRDDAPPVLEVEDHGTYLAIDRIGHGSDIDIYSEDCNPDGTMFAHSKRVWEVPL